MSAGTSPRAAEFDALLRPALEPAYRVAFHLSRNKADAEDIVQEAALLAWRSFDSFEAGTHFRAWFHRIVTNVFLSRCRAEKRRGMMVPLEADYGTRGDRTSADERWAAESPDAAEGILAGITVERVQAALATLPKEYRTVAILYFVDDLSYEQIAAAVECPVGTVRSRLHRARRILRQQLLAVARERGLRAAV
ncbi:MAG TPA: sigma-70 family RNA polymerase sigma factor [Gemmatimonadales bacterium]|nr:sigma-70 family RNA polymerase sigma factor [Gemmatimonadales bacterium]